MEQSGLMGRSHSRWDRPGERGPEHKHRGRAERQKPSGRRPIPPSAMDRSIQGTRGKQPRMKTSKGAQHRNA